MVVAAVRMKLMASEKSQSQVAGSTGDGLMIQLLDATKMTRMTDCDERFVVCQSCRRTP